jgi:hypothetical protein
MKPLANKAEAQRMAKKIGLPAGPLSFTQMNTWLMCHKAYWHNYINRTPWDGWSENLVLGSAMHRGLEHVNREKMTGSIVSVERGSQAIYTSAYHELDKAKAVLDRPQKKKFEKQLEMLSKLLNVWTNKHLPGYNPTTVEETFYVLLGGIPMVVKIDMIDDNRKVSDFKLTGTFKRKETVQDSLQLSVYAAATKINLTSFISLRMPKFGTKKGWTPDIEEVIVRKKNMDLEWAEDIAASVSKGIIMGDWSYCDPSSYKCSQKYCDVWSKCRGRQSIDRPKWMRNMIEPRR